MKSYLYDRYDTDAIVDALADAVARRRDTVTFYQDRAADYPDIDSIDAFQDLPIIDKHDLLDAGDRQGAVLFADTPVDDMFAMATSGTSGTAAISRKTWRDHEILQLKHRRDFPDAGNRVIILFGGSWRHTVSGMLHDQGCFVVAGRGDDLPYSRELVMALDLDTVFATPTQALKLGRLLDDAGFDTSRITALYLLGELISPIMAARLTDRYPDATLVSDYGSAEACIMNTMCREASPNVHHVDPEYTFVEVVDPDTGEPCDVGEEGTLVHTPLWQDTGAPLIRYDTGDRAVVREPDCDCEHTGPTVEIQGRMEFDTVKIAGLTLYKENFEEALASIAPFIGGEYQVHIDEEVVDGDVVPSLRIQIVPRQDVKRPDAMRRDLAETVMNSFEVTADETWRDRVDADAFNPITVEFVSPDAFSGPKVTHLVDHRGD